MLFLLELARAAGDKAYREETAVGADYLVATLPARELSSPDSPLGTYHRMSERIDFFAEIAHQKNGLGKAREKALAASSA